MVRGTVLLRVLRNLVNLLGIPSSLNFAAMGGGDPVRGDRRPGVAAAKGAEGGEAELGNGEGTGRRGGVSARLVKVVSLPPFRAMFSLERWRRSVLAMAVMLGNLYRALVTAGAPDEDAQRAAEEVAGFESRLTGIESKVSLLQGMVGFNLALTAAIAIKLLVP